MQKEIKKLIQKLVETDVDFVVEHPADLSHGDYSTNIAMVLAKKLEKNPRELAEDIVKKIESKISSDQSNQIEEPFDLIDRVEIAGPGFINFYLKSEFFVREIQKIIHLENNFGRNKRLEGKTIFMDYTDPNPFKQFHIGHLMSNAIGESIARIFEWNGATVKRLCYGGDVGPHVAKTIWGMKQMREAFPYDTDSLTDKTKFLGDAYVLGDKAYKASEKGDTLDGVPDGAKAEIDEINKRVYQLFDDTKENDDPDVEVYFQKGKTWSLQHFDEIYHKLGTNFDMQIFESTTFPIGEKIIRDNTPGVFELSEGAIIYRGEDEGLHTRVFVNSLGLPTYESKDIGLAHYKDTKVSDKLGEYKASVIITANEQKEYFKVVLAALDKINTEVSKKTKHMSHGMMRFADGKMSSRLGNVVTGESLILNMENMVEEKIADRGFESVEAEKVKTDIAVGAIKYSILKNAIGRDIIFDPETSISFEGDSGPYLQYTYSRAKSIIDKAAEEGIKIVDILRGEDGSKKDFSKFGNSVLEKKIYRFSEVVEKSYEEFAPQQIITFVTELAGEFNSYYASNQILDGGDDQEYKVALAKAVMHTIHNGLNILGIKAPERM
jgi:arginyl-tRNA synthetase